MDKKVKGEQSKQFYEVEEILDRKKVKGKFQYLIKWKGYRLSESTWEPVSHLQYMKDSVIQFNALLDKAKNEAVSPTNKENENSDNGNTRGRRKKILQKKNQLLNEELGIENKELGLKEDEEEEKIKNKPELSKNKEKPKASEREKEKEKKPEVIMNDQRRKLRSSVAKKEENILQNELINNIDRPKKNRPKKTQRSSSKFIRNKISKSRGRFQKKEDKDNTEEKKEEKDEKEEKKEEIYDEKKEEKKEEEKINEKEENIHRKMFYIDEDYTQILGIKMENQKLIAVVEKKDNDLTKQELLSTKELKIINPWILIDYYENRINFE